MFETLEKYKSTSGQIVELGAGYGSRLFELSSRDEFSNYRFVGLELTYSGQEIMKAVGSKNKIDLEVGHIDFVSGEYDHALIEPGAIMFTSFALMYVEKYSTKLRKLIEETKPKIFVAFEPCGTEFTLSKKYGKLRHQYSINNNYALDTRSELIKTFSNFPDYFLSNEIPNIIGMNPLLPMSILEFTQIRPW